VRTCDCKYQTDPPDSPRVTPARVHCIDRTVQNRTLEAHPLKQRNKRHTSDSRQRASCNQKQQEIHESIKSAKIKGKGRQFV